MKKLLVMISLVAVFIACDNTTLDKGLCDGNAQDIQGLEGKYTYNMMGESLDVEFVKEVKAGEYTVVITGLEDEEEDDDNGIVQTCVINNTTYMETIDVDPDTGKSNMELYTLNKRAAHVLQVKSVLFDSAKLSALGISFTNSENEMGFNNTEISNKNVSTETLLKAADLDTDEAMIIDLIKL